MPLQWFYQTQEPFFYVAFQKGSEFFFTGFVVGIEPLAFYIGEESHIDAWRHKRTKGEGLEIVESAKLVARYFTYRNEVLVTNAVLIF